MRAVLKQVLRHQRPSPLEAADGLQRWEPSLNSEK